MAAVLDDKEKQEAAPLFWAVRDARDLSSAQACSDALEAYLKRHNISALNSYLEAKDDLLVIHKLKMGAQLKKFSLARSKMLASGRYFLRSED